MLIKAIIAYALVKHKKGKALIKVAAIAGFVWFTYTILTFSYGLYFAYQHGIEYTEAMGVVARAAVFLPLIFSLPGSILCWMAAGDYEKLGSQSGWVKGLTGGILLLLGGGLSTIGGILGIIGAINMRARGN